MAVERHAGFQTQAVAGTQADRPDLGKAQEFVPQVADTIRREADFEAVLAGIARARNIGGFTQQVEGSTFHEIKIAGFRAKFLHHLVRLGALQGQQRAFGQDFELDVGTGFVIGDRVGDDLEILVLARRIDDQQETFGLGPRHHPVVQDAALGIEQQRVLLLAGRQDGKIGRGQGLERGDGALARQPRLAHVRHVEQAGGRSRPLMFGQHAFVLHGHVIAGKRHHTRAKCDVAIVKRCIL